MLTEAAAPPRPGAARRLLDWRLRFLVLAVIWGASFLFIKVAVEALAPVQVTLGRCLAGAVAIGAILAVRREPLPRDLRTWWHLAVAALLSNVIPFTLFGYAEERVPSALAGICNAATPLFTVGVAVLALPDERPTGRRTAGLAVGFAGVLVVLGVWHGGLGHDAAGALMALGAALCYGLGWTYTRRFVSSGGHSSFALTTAQMIAATVQCAVLTPVLASAPAHLPLRVVLAVAALGALGTGVAYVLQHGLIRDAGATVASTVTYVAPIVAVTVGVVLLGEHLTWNEPAGALVIIGGAVLVGGSGARRRPKPAPRDAGLTSPD